MGEAKKRGSFDIRKEQALKLKSREETEALRAQKKKEQEETIYRERLLAFAKSKLSITKPRLLQFTKSIEESLISKNYFAALTIALTLPDICCSLEDENRRTSGKKYAEWFQKYVGSKYTSKIGHEKVETIFLSGEECFALRCTYLHKGINHIEDERILKDYEGGSNKIEFMAEMNSDCVIVNGVLLLKLENFCCNIIKGVNQWLSDKKDDFIIRKRISEIPEIYTSSFSPIPGVLIGG